MLASTAHKGIGPSLAVEGSTTREAFEAYLGRLFAPSLEPGQVEVMDNLSSHKDGKVSELIEERVCALLYLPAYSPDFTLIEEAFSKIKRLVLKAEARGREAPVDVSGKTLDAASAPDAKAYFEHLRYPRASQLL